jgi:hypothetical protein
MNKEEILAKARRENKGQDIAELAVQSKAHGIAGAAVLLLCASVELIATIMHEGHRGAFFRIVFSSYNAVFGIVRYIAGKRRGLTSEWGVIWLVYGLLMTGFTVVFICFLLRDLKAGAI